MKLIAGLFVLLSGVASASPLVTVLHKAPSTAVSDETAAAIVRGFRECTTKETFPREIFEAAGIRYGANGLPVNGRYKLNKPVALASGIHLKTVAIADASANGKPMRSIMLGFNKALSAVKPVLESNGKLSFDPAYPPGRTDVVWFEFDEEAGLDFTQQITCHRYK